MKRSDFKSIEEYINTFPRDVQVIIERLRQTIRNSAPKAEEKISYQIPTFTLNGNLVHFGGYKNHIVFYPGSGAIEKFKKKLSSYKLSKGTVQFPLDQPLPLELISRIVEYNVKVNSEKKSAY